MSSKLSDEDILNELNAISDSMAFDSDEGGDSDAEDDILHPSLVGSPTTNSSPNSFWSLKTRSSSKLFYLFYFILFENYLQYLLYTYRCKYHSKYYNRFKY